MSNQIIQRLNLNWQNNLLENSEVIALLRKLRGIEKVNLFKSLELGLVKIPKPEDYPPNISKYLKSFGATEIELEGMISIPLYKKAGNITNFLYLSLNGKDDRIIRTGGIINLKAFTAFKRIILVDTIEDYFAYFQHVRENVVPLIQSGPMMEDLAEIIKNSEVEEIIFMNDSPYWEPLQEKIKDYDGKMYEISLPDNISIKEFLKKNSRKRFIAYIEAEKAKIMKKMKEEQSPEDTKKEYLKVTEDIGEMRFTGDDRMYRVRGFNKDGFEKIVQICLEVEERTFPDKVDLSRSQGRARFSNIASTEFEMSAELIRDDLAFIYKTLDKLQDERFREKRGLSEKTVYIITPQEINKTIDLLTRRDVLDEMLIKDTEKFGYVGEEINKKLFYIAVTSRLTKEPISVLDISPPGTGKSFGISTIVDLVPPDESIKVSRLTEHSLYYKKEEELRGKVLYIEEIVGMEESLESIRMLISSGELGVEVTEKDPRTGQHVTVTRRSKVDVPVLSSGTRDVFDEETLSRFILTYNDATQKHMERVLKAQAERFSLNGEKINRQRERYLKKHRDIQKVLDPDIVVVNPYTDRIMINPSIHIVTRKQEQYLRLMYNIAFIRQHSRKKYKDVDRYGNEFEYIRVEKMDIVTANEIASYVFRYLKDLTKRLHDAYQTIMNYCIEMTKDKRISIYEFKFSRREIRESAGLDPTTTKRLFDELERLEYIRKVRGNKQGMQYLYRLVPYNEKKKRDENLKLLDPNDI